MLNTLRLYKVDLELAIQDFDIARDTYKLVGNTEEAIEVVERIRGEADAMLALLRRSEPA